ncbi:hypothetical protein FACS1894211_14380 [Clostridia bacterium]|nr:hypothetical protein FACS1894211_14380 [Clostridia bacterium]
MGEAIDERDIYDERGIIEYITKFDINAVNADNPDLAKYPKGARIVTASQGFEKYEGLPIELNCQEHS